MFPVQCMYTDVADFLLGSGGLSNVHGEAYRTNSFQAGHTSRLYCS